MKSKAPIQHTEVKATPGKWSYAKEPKLKIIQEKNKVVLWIGNDDGYNDLTYATVSGPKTLEKFAKALLKALKKKV